MKTNRSSNFSAENVAADSSLSPKLKELQGSFALEGIVISDEQMLKYSADFREAEARGKAAAEIERAIKEIR
jgi:hypothetical protein